MRRSLLLALHICLAVTSLGAATTTSSRCNLTLRFEPGEKSSLALVILEEQPPRIVAMSVSGGEIDTLRIPAAFPYAIVSRRVDEIEQHHCLRFYSPETADRPPQLVEIIVIAEHGAIRFATDAEFEAFTKVEPNHQSYERNM